MSINNKRYPAVDSGTLEAMLETASMAEPAKIADAAPSAALRLAQKVVGGTSQQAQLVARCLASIYDGAGAPRIRLDEIRWLDWTLQRDLVIVMLGTGCSGFEDYHIREAFYVVGGTPAVNWFHEFTHRAA